MLVSVKRKSIMSHGFDDRILPANTRRDSCLRDEVEEVNKASVYEATEKRAASELKLAGNTTTC